MKAQIACLAATMLALLLPPAVQAGRERPFLDEPRNMSQPNPDDIVEIPWEEGQSALPGYPKQADLLEFRVNRQESQFRYYIDSKSLSIGEGDEVVRYTSVIVSASGSWNVAHEGMRCDTKEFKTYAFGVGDKFQAVRDPKWEEMKESSYTRYRSDLWDYHFCEVGLVRPVEDILRSLRSGTGKGNTPSVF